MPDTPPDEQRRLPRPRPPIEVPAPLRGTALDTIRDVSSSPATLELAPPSPKAFRPLPVEQHTFANRYVTRSVLGVGGMGEVRLCSDLRIGREVALKVTRAGMQASGDSRARFVREARLQGQLEHPAIVPVYDLGAASDGEWFTMKRVRGATLEHVLGGLTIGDHDITTRYSLRKLLAQFVQFANAVAYAHSRGVVHRDLKPSNVMFGDYGEVYVLDWGVAKVLGHSEVAIEDDDVLTRATEGTQAGSIMGTPGYMAPEQALGRLDRIDARTDVYALGAILFELLTLQSLHPLDSVDAALHSTLKPHDARPTQRAPHRSPPPELDAVCVRATAMEPADRYASAGELAAAVERFLDGDRDLALRRAMAEDQIASARLALVEGNQSEAAVTEALRALNRAVALDPNNDLAVRAMAAVLLRIPAELSPEAEAELQQESDLERRAVARSGVFAFLSWFALAPLLLVAGVQSWGTMIVIFVVVALAAVLARWIETRKQAPDDASAAGLLVLSTAAIGIATTYLGPFVLVPGWACQNTLVFAMHADRGWKRLATIGMGTLAILVPLGLELLGVIPPSFTFEAGRLVILPRLAALPAAATLGLLVIGNMAMVFVPSLIVAQVRDGAVDARRRLVAHLSRLRKLVPDEAFLTPRR